MNNILCPPLRTVRLFGDLGKRFGSVHHFAVKTPSEAVRALSVNFPGFEKHLIDSGSRNVGYQVNVDGRDIDETELSYPLSREIHLTPVICGAGSPTAKIIIGAVLIVAGIYVSIQSGGFASWAGGAMINAGIVLMVGGVMQMLSPIPKTEDQGGRSPSYVFNGPVNTAARGPVPVGYGRLVVGSAVISAGIVIDDISIGDPLYDPDTAERLRLAQNEQDANNAQANQQVQDDPPNVPAEVQSYG